MNKAYLIALLLLVSSPALAEIYKYHDADGRLYFTDKQMDTSFKLLSIFRPHLTTKSHTGYNFNTYQRNKSKYLPYIQYVAKQYSIDPILLHAIVDTESAFNPKAISKAGAVGLMQLMPQTAKGLGVQNSLNPQQNLQGGANYFRQLLDQFDQNIELSLAAYNAGPTTIIKAGTKIPNYPETKKYVKKVLTKYQSLQ